MPPTLNVLSLDTGVGSDQLNIAGPSTTNHTWDTTNSIQGGSLFLRRLSNQIAGKTGGQPESYINSITYAQNQTAQFEFAAIPPDATHYAYIWARIQNPGTGALNGVFCAWNGTGGTTHGYCIANAVTFLSSATIAAPVIGNIIRLEFLSNVLTMWVFRAGAWAIANQTAMNPYSGGGYVGIELNIGDVSSRLINFQGGDENTTSPGVSNFRMCGA